MILFLVLLFGYIVSFGQSQAILKYQVKGKQVIIDDQEASLAIEGYDGDELIIEPYISTVTEKIPSDATGLSLLQSAIEKEDNIVHPEVLKNEANLFSIRFLKSNCRHLRIKIPQNAHLKVSFVIGSPEAKVSFTNLAGELEVEGASPIIELNYITGPVILSPGKTGHGIGASEKIIVSHLYMQKHNNIDKDTPFLNIITNYADVDISLPESLKATIQVNLPYYSNLYSDLNIIPQKSNIPLVKGRYTGELNGGGEMIAVNSTFGNVFIRKQK